MEALHAFLDTLALAFVAKPLRGEGGQDKFARASCSNRTTEFLRHPQLLPNSPRTVKVRSLTVTSRVRGARRELVAEESTVGR